ncbi:MAG: homocysteine S-methyltransferase family protein [Clostridia bacterium]|nr:homocysteine S-methyltransferase family protein [Clostridia bacterium]
MNFRDYLKNNIVYLDGGMGTILQKNGLKPGEYPERWNTTHSGVIRAIHKEYFDAGSNVVNTNTFGANTLKFTSEELDEIVKAAIENVKWARDNSVSKNNKYIALDIGPSGKMLKPYGDFDFEEAVSVFAETVKLGVKYGVDLITIETMNDSYETKAALLAVKENSDLPVIVTNAYGEDGKLMTGATPSAMVAMLEGMGADAIGVNCSLGPKQLSGVVDELLKVASVPVVMKPNAGLPVSVNGETVYDVLPDEFAIDVSEMVKKGVRVAGGCCGTTPEYIKSLVSASKDIEPVLVTKKNITCVSSYTHSVVFDESPVLIGERINPTGKKRFKQALIEKDMDYILGEGINQQDKGVHILDVNVGLPDIDEKEMLVDSVCELQAVCDLPLQIDTSDAEAMEAALRRYNGKAMINSVNGKEESMKAIFPLVKKYGGLVVALTLDENGIPETAEGRVAIAKKILANAAEYGIDKKDIIFDPLAMTISADTKAAKVTLDSLRIIKEKLGCHTSLGVSNVSFGLPARDIVNGVFFVSALENGLSAAIMNPYSSEMMKTYFAFRALHDMDENCADYISFAEDYSESVMPASISPKKEKIEEYKSALQRAVVKGLKDKAAAITENLLSQQEPLDIVQNEIIPALDIVGKGFEAKTVYLPQLLMSAEAAKSAFECIKNAMIKSNSQSDTKCSIVIATVKGDIHDIGKNIVKLLLENYGFAVYDLGKDVDPEKIADEVVNRKAAMVGLSALMTTTVPAMEKTIKLIRERAPWCRIMVGGAVLNKEYGKRIGADYYAKDAMEGVRYAESVNTEVV